MAKRQFLVFPQSTFESLFSAVYQGLAVSVCVTIACFPLVGALAIVADPLASWPFFLALSALVGPAIAAAFGTFMRIRRDDEVRPFAQFVASYRTTFLRSLLIWCCFLAMIAIIIVDIWAVGHWEVSAPAIPALVLIAALLFVIVIAMLHGVVSAPQLRMWRLVATSFYVSIRLWQVSLLTIALFACLVVAFAFQPVLGSLITPGFLLFVVWSNYRFAFTKVAETATAHG